MSNSLQLAFQFSLPQRPWQILLRGNEMMLEVRDMEQMALGVSSVGRWGQMENFSLPLDWWHKLMAFDAEYLVFERIEDSMDPGACSLHAYPRKSGGQDYHFDKARFVDLHGGFLYFKMEEGETRQLQLGRELPQEAPISMLHGQNFMSEHPDFELLAGFISNHAHMKPVHQIEYLDFNNMMLFSFYVLESKGFSNFMGVWDVQGDQKLFQLLEPNVEKVAPGSFFIWHDLLIFVSEKVKLNAYKLRL
jgi:hypothetical protein